MCLQTMGYTTQKFACLYFYTAMVIVNQACCGVNPPHLAETEKCSTSKPENNLLPFFSVPALVLGKSNSFMHKSCVLPHIASLIVIYWNYTSGSMLVKADRGLKLLRAGYMWKEEKKVQDRRHGKEERCEIEEKKEEELCVNCRWLQRHDKYMIRQSWAVRRTNAAEVAFQEILFGFLYVASNDAACHWNLHSRWPASCVSSFHFYSSL